MLTIHSLFSLSPALCAKAGWNRSKLASFWKKQAMIKDPLKGFQCTVPGCFAVNVIIWLGEGWGDILLLLFPTHNSRHYLKPVPRYCSIFNKGNLGISKGSVILIPRMFQSKWCFPNFLSKSCISSNNVSIPHKNALDCLIKGKDQEGIYHLSQSLSLLTILLDILTVLLKSELNCVFSHREGECVYVLCMYL